MLTITDTAEAHQATCSVSTETRFTWSRLGRIPNQLNQIRALIPDFIKSIFILSCHLLVV
jgi:hypothetical protein